MDIVDTFNHLIPSEHLDDALFLGSNLESEGCEEFATSQHVIEDSLKNMLSDKDPMLGSASSQFCLPGLDATDPNFQISSSAGVGLDDIMDVGIVKEIGSDLNDEDDLILPNKDVASLNDPTVKILRKSPRLIAQGSVRNLRKSTTEKHSNLLQGTRPKAKTSRKNTSDEQQNDEVLPPENAENANDKISQSEKINTSLNSRRSTRISHKEHKDNMITNKNLAQNQTDEACGEMHCDLISNTPSVLERKGHSETLQGDPLILSKDSTENILDEISEPGLIHSQGLEHPEAEVLKKPTEEKIYEGEIYHHSDKKTDVIYDKVHKELALLSGVVKCDLEVEVHSAMESKSSLENPDDRTAQEQSNTDKCLSASDHTGMEFRQISDTDVAGLNSSVQKYQELCQEEEIVQMAVQQTSQWGEGCSKQTTARKSPKKLKSKSGKTCLQSASSTHKNLSAAKHACMNPKTRKGRVKTAKVHCIESDVHLKVHASHQERQNVKVKKKISENLKGTKDLSKSRKAKKKMCSTNKKLSQGSLDTAVKQQLDDASRDTQGNLNEEPYPTSSYVPARPRSLSHSSDKHHFQALSKVDNRGKDSGEQKDVVDNSEEKTKLKKSLPPRQRRSSKSISVDEPQLFIPDNIPNVKKESTEVTSPSDKQVWNTVRHCCSCRKLHGNRFMVGCGRCDDWFHGDCVGLSLSQAQQMEADDREYICVKCCDEEEKIELTNPALSDNRQKTELQQEIKVESDKSAMKTQAADCPSLLHEKSKQTDNTTKMKANISRKKLLIEEFCTVSTWGVELEEVEGDFTLKILSVLMCPALQKERLHSMVPVPPYELTRKGFNWQEQGGFFGIRIISKSKGFLVQSGHERQESKKKKQEKKGTPSLQASTPPTSKPSVDQIRQSVRQSLTDILVKRLSESSSKIPEERATKVSARIEKELFSFYRDTDSKYKNKYRSLMFNLKDPKNNVLYKRVLKGEITPEHLIKMSPEELASRELAAWRQRENRHTIEMIEKEQREVERRPITKITHKGEIEIESETPMKEPEAMDTEESVVKPAEKEEEIQKDTDVHVESTSDTTTQHKNHLFDLNCKICTGRMAPPAEDLSPKKVKIPSGTVHRQSDNEADSIAEVHSSSSSVLNIDVLEAEKRESPKETFSSITSSEPFNITDMDESTFLARINCIWEGYLNMPSVAKFVIKAYPVSGSLEHLTEDLPESIQVGGRISPQTVWDYVDKIKASGTKETCVIRFSPVTEEDQISYTLLYSYFSSRKRYGVVANNMRQVKDMYLIPLGASEKIPHFFVPFDGPGLEVHRPNLLLALIIRQKVKRQHSTSLDDEPPGSLISSPLEKKNRTEIANEDDEEDDENDFFNSFTAVLHKNRNRAPLSDTDEPQTVIECVPEPIKREPPKPLRFLPGVLVGWETPQSTLDLASKPLPDDDILQSLLGTTEKAFDHKQSITIVSNADKPLVEDKMNTVEETISSEILSDDKTEHMDLIPENVEEANDTPALITSLPSGTSVGLSLKGKPPDVSTEAYLANINVQSNDEEIDKRLVDEPSDAKNEIGKTTNPIMCPAPVNVNTVCIDDPNAESSDNLANPVRSPKLINIKRDPRQAGRSHKVSSLEIKDYDLGKNEESSPKNKEDMEIVYSHKKDKLKKQSHEEADLHVSKSDKLKCALPFSSSAQNELENSEMSKTVKSKTFSQDLLIDDTDPLQQFRRALAANKSKSQASNTTQSQTSNALHSETSSKSPVAAYGGNFSTVRLQQPPFLPIKGNPSAFSFQHNPRFPPHSNPIFPYAPHIPPLLPTPLSIGFPRPNRFQSAETGLHNPLVAWHPAVQLSRQPPNYLGQLTPGPLLGPEQTRFQGPQKFYRTDHRGPERRHSDPWDKQDRLSERSSRGSRSEYRQRFYSESHHSREKRQYEKETASDKNGDKDSERSRRKDRVKERSRDRDKERSHDRDKEKSHDRDRKIRDESHRDKDRSRTSHSDKSSDSKTHKEGRSADKSKNEDRNSDKEKSRDRIRDKDEEKERDRHHKDRDREHNDKMKSKR
ncbi:PHD finger protein 3 [Rhinophrynus dorsalis]